MKTNQLKNDNLVKLPASSQEEKVFQQIESDQTLGSWMLGEEATFTEKIKYNLCQSIVRYKRKEKLSLSKIAERLGLDEETTNKLLHYYIENFALDSLIAYAEKLRVPFRMKIIQEARA